MFVEHALGLTIR